MTNGFKENAIFWIEVDKIKPNPYQPRKEFDEEALKSLAESIKQYGVLQPLVVTRKEEELEDGGMRVYYELVAGERRLRAAKLAGLNQVPVIIRDKEDSDQEKLELAIIENLQREDLNPIDRALAFKRLYDEFKMTHAQIAKKIGKSREYVSNALRLLTLPEDIQRAIANGIISEGHARPLLMLTDKPEEQETLFKEIVMKKLTVREAEHIARSVATEKLRKHDIPPELRKIEKELSENLGTRVRIEQKEDGVGRVHIDFTSEDDLKHLLELVKKHREHALSPRPKRLESGDAAALGALESALGGMANIEQEKQGEFSAQSNDTNQASESSSNIIESNILQENLNSTYETDSASSAEQTSNTFAQSNENVAADQSNTGTEEYEIKYSEAGTGFINNNNLNNTVSNHDNNAHAEIEPESYANQEMSNGLQSDTNPDLAAPGGTNSGNTTDAEDELDWQELLRSGFSDADSNKQIDVENPDSNNIQNVEIDSDDVYHVFADSNIDDSINDDSASSVANQEIEQLENLQNSPDSTEGFTQTPTNDNQALSSTQNTQESGEVFNQGNEKLETANPEEVGQAEETTQNIPHAGSGLDAFAQAVENTLSELEKEKLEKEKAKQNIYPMGKRSDEPLPPELAQINQKLQSDISRLMESSAADDDTKDIGVEFRELSEEELSMPGYDGPKTMAKSMNPDTKENSLADTMTDSNFATPNQNFGDMQSENNLGSINNAYSNNDNDFDAGSPFINKAA